MKKAVHLFVMGSSIATLVVILLSMIDTARATTTDPTTPIPDECAVATSWIGHADMVARMKAQHNGAVVLQSGALATDANGNNRKLEIYQDPATAIWYDTEILRSPAMFGWTTKATSPTCLFAYGDPVLIPAPPVAVVPAK
jgi:hypothetical protein